jgi:hypothetical protein
MESLFKETHYPVSLLIENIDRGQIGLPDLQRPFVWPTVRIRDLFDSMYRGFPVGYLLFWQSSSDGRQIGTDGKQAAPSLLIVDGQQRLTSLYAVLKGKPIINSDYKEVKIDIAFRPSDGTFEVADAAIRKDPEFISDISKLWAKGTTQYKFINDFFAATKQRRSISPEEEAQLADAVNRLYGIDGYSFTALELSSKMSEEQVADVFVRINSKGKNLKQADFILTLMSVFWDEGRKQLEQFCYACRKPVADGASPFNHFIMPDPDELLRVAVGFGFRRARLQHVYSLLRGKDFDTDLFSDATREKNFATLKHAQPKLLDVQTWHEFLDTLVAAGFRSGEMITSKNSILYTYVLFLIGKHDFSVDNFSLRGVISRWFFMSSLTGRYTGSFETQVEADFARLRAVTSAKDFVSALDQIITTTLTDDFWRITLPDQLAVSSSRTPAVFAYYAALVVLNAPLLFSSIPVAASLDPSRRRRRKATDRHHLFPKNYLKNLVPPIEDRSEVNQVANFALLEYQDNIRISDMPPFEYFPKYAFRHTPEQLRKMMSWHALPEGWTSLSYSDFLLQRRKLMADVIREGFGILQTRTKDDLDKVLADWATEASVLPTEAETNHGPFDPQTGGFQYGVVYDLYRRLSDGQWHSLEELEKITAGRANCVDRLVRLRRRGIHRGWWVLEEKDGRYRMHLSEQAAAANA